MELQTSVAHPIVVDDLSQPGLTKLPSGVLNYQDDPVARHQSNVEVPYEIYNRFSKHRKHITVAVISWCGLLSPISSTAVLSALPEVAAEYKTSGDIISLSNALYLVFMAISPCFWGPLSQVYGRKWVTSFPTNPSSHLATGPLSTSCRLIINIGDMADTLI